MKKSSKKPILVATHPATKFLNHSILEQMKPILKDKENIMESMKQYVKDTADNITSKLWN